MNKRFLKKTLKAQQIEYIINKRLWQALKDQQIEYIINKKTLTCVESPTRSIIWMLSHNIIWRCMVSRVWKHVFFFFLFWTCMGCIGEWPPMPQWQRGAGRRWSYNSGQSPEKKRAAAAPKCGWSGLLQDESPSWGSYRVAIEDWSMAERSPTRLVFQK